MTIGDRTLSVILPNYNGSALLAANLPSLFEALHQINLDGYEVIVVDDCSSDDSVDYLVKNHPDIKIIRNTLNLGFSKTCNIGIRAAKSRLLCITNTDVTFTPDYFAKAIPYFSDEAVYAVKGDIINYQSTIDQPINTERTSKLYYKRGFLRFDQRVEPLRTLTGRIEGQFVLLGCCFTCDREKTLALHGYDEIYSPFYWEDADLALRAINQGHKLLYAPECRVYHQISSTISKTQTNVRRRLVSIRNKFLFTWHHLAGAKNWTLHVVFVFMSLVTRWVILDWRYYVSFVWALGRQCRYLSASEK